MHTQSYTLVSGVIQEGGCNGLILLGKLIYFWQFVLIINGVILVSSFMLNNEIIFVCSQTSMGDWQNIKTRKPAYHFNMTLSYYIWGSTYNPEGRNWIDCDYVSMHCDDFNIFNIFLNVLN